MASRKGIARGFSAFRTLRAAKGFPASSEPGPLILRQRNKILLPVSTAVDVSYREYAVKPRPKEGPEEMFCYQCEQTKSRKGCTEIGVCGKTPDVAALQDMLVHVVKGIAIYANRVKKTGNEVPREIGEFTFLALFSTLTNVNFDGDRFSTYIADAVRYRDQMRDLYESICADKGVASEVFLHGPAHWRPFDDKYDVDSLIEEGKRVTLRGEELIFGADVHGVRQMIIYGLKGMASYARHAQLVDQYDSTVCDFAFEILDWLCTGPESETHDLGQNLGWALKVGENNVKGMQLLDNGHCEKYGNPSPTQVRLNPVEGKCILVSGHDLHDMENILKLTEGTGINVYTHGELLPAHGYPGLRKHKHLAGHYGGAWQLQRFEFPMFPGPIVITTNCVTEPMKSYKQRIFTVNETGWPGVTHLKNLEKDFQQVIDVAMEMEGYPKPRTSQAKDERTLTVGFGHHAIISNADKVIGAVHSGELKRVFLVGGCDGAENKRTYFSKLVNNLPEDTLILTLGCAKYRFNRQEFGELGTTGLPRLLDMGQCNDAYGAVVVATELAKAFNTDINSLPLSLNISWFEQKAVAVLLSLLHLGVKNIRLGPVLPAFITPTVLSILQENYNIMPVQVRNVHDDIKEMMGGH